MVRFLKLSVGFNERSEVLSLTDNYFTQSERSIVVLFSARFALARLFASRFSFWFLSFELMSTNNFMDWLRHHIKCVNAFNRYFWAYLLFWIISYRLCVPYIRFAKRKSLNLRSGGARDLDWLRWLWDIDYRPKTCRFLTNSIHRHQLHCQLPF